MKECRNSRNKALIGIIEVRNREQDTGRHNIKIINLKMMTKMIIRLVMVGFIQKIKKRMRIQILVVHITEETEEGLSKEVEVNKEEEMIEEDTEEEVMQEDIEVGENL